MREADVAEASRIMRQAFGTFLGLPDPNAFAAGREYVATRWKANPEGALVAESDGRLAGSNIATRWGSFGFFGPLTVRPDLWDLGVAQKLLGPTMELFAKWGVRETGLFTFANSAKHIGLYQKFGFWPRFLTALMSKGVEGRKAPATKFSTLSDVDQQLALGACRMLTDSLYDGLDVSLEIRALSEQHLGETVLLWGGDMLEAFAVCHCGEGSEGGPGNCYLKFAAVRHGAPAERSFEHLLDACEALAAEQGLQKLEAGVNLSRSRAYRHLLRLGFRTQMLGVAMHRPDSPAYNRPEVFVIDDWR